MCIHVISGCKAWRLAVPLISAFCCLAFESSNMLHDYFE